MSASKEVTIWCDQCPRREQLSGGSVARVRAILKRGGWGRVRSRDLCPEWGGSRDLCPECLAQHKKRRDPECAATASVPVVIVIPRPVVKGATTS